MCGNKFRVECVFIWLLIKMVRKIGVDSFALLTTGGQLKWMNDIWEWDILRILFFSSRMTNYFACCSSNKQPAFWTKKLSPQSYALKINSDIWTSVCIANVFCRHVLAASVPKRKTIFLVRNSCMSHRWKLVWARNKITSNRKTSWIKYDGWRRRINIFFFPSNKLVCVLHSTPHIYWLDPCYAYRASVQAINGKVVTVCSCAFPSHESFRLLNESYSICSIYTIGTISMRMNLLQFRFWPTSRRKKNSNTTTRCWMRILSCWYSPEIEIKLCKHTNQRTKHIQRSHKNRLLCTD